MIDKLITGIMGVVLFMAIFFSLILISGIPQ